jgi:hypothetical protein
VLNRDGFGGNLGLTLSPRFWDEPGSIAGTPTVATFRRLSTTPLASSCAHFNIARDDESEYELEYMPQDIGDMSFQGFGDVYLQDELFSFAELAREVQRNVVMVDEAEIEDYVSAMAEFH